MLPPFGRWFSWTSRRFSCAQLLPSLTDGSHASAEAPVGQQASPHALNQPLAHPVSVGPVARAPERPPEIESRATPGHWEVDTIVGTDRGRHSIVTLVERMAGFVVRGKLERHTATECTTKVIELISRVEGRVATITADNGTEFHSYRQIEAATGVEFYFATPHHSWERGTNENTNGLIRQYLPKKTSFAEVTQADCDEIARKLNTRPRKRLGYKTPEECYATAG